jgi:citrate lyase subunit beta/citryl-CoA lyase
MTLTLRPRRSVLYMPGSNARALDKARSLPADALILDLEDATAPDAKEIARQQVCDAVKQGGYGSRELIIRVNGLDTPWGRDDVAAAAAVGPDAVLLPKVENRGQVLEVEALLEKHGAPARTAIWCMMETPRGMLHAEEVADASKRLACLVMGTNDLVKELLARHTPMRLPVVPAMALCLLAARAAGLAIIDGVYNDFKDEAGFIAACQQGLELGFDGKTLIHPGQVEPCNRVFAPDEAEIAQARRLIEGFQQAQREGKAVAVVDGKMVEKMHMDNASRLVALSEAIARMNAA